MFNEANELQNQEDENNQKNHGKSHMSERKEDAINDNNDWWRLNGIAKPAEIVMKCDRSIVHRKNKIIRDAYICQITAAQNIHQHTPRILKQQQQKRFPI